jgi:MFS family permease
MTRSQISPTRLFGASCVALVTTAMSFALRAAAAESWALQFHLSNERLGWINGTAFWGFTLSIIFGGMLCDTLGLGRIIGLAFACHLAGILLTVVAWNYWSLYAATLLTGIGNGSVEAAANPMIPTLFPATRTVKLNRFHSWYNIGVVVGGLCALGLGHFGLGWRLQFATMLAPLAAYGLWFSRESFPRTERVQQGISGAAMFSACLNPWFLLMIVCMLFTAATELGPTQWIPLILSHAGVSGVLVLVWISGVMAVGRQFAATAVNRLYPLGTLLLSSILSGAGLYAMSRATGNVLFVDATVFALGVCFFWPTMLGYVSETFPETGAAGFAVMGGAGLLSVSFVLPMMGRIFDRGIAARLAPADRLADLAAALPGSELFARWIGIQAAAGQETLGKVALLPAALCLVFGFLLLVRGRRQQPRSGTPDPR